MTSSDALLNALGKDGVFLDINPQFDAKPQVVPLSNPYADPVTGKRYQDVATVQPAPDGRTAEVQVAKQEVDSQGNPVTDASGVAAAPQKQDDPCVGHEDRLGCMTTGEVPQGPDLGKDERHITITPDTGWGADTAACPADIVVPMHLRGAQSLSFSYQPVCKAADMFRPAILGVAWIVAVLIALGMGFKGGSD
ncbi:virulence factor TspB C-terminal domain-related protein [Ralstonia sp. 25mfcol4.1]|uniref:virulence factor TspB C-terminal domain-related protein n=1 Tax=Ralstonia sp. 25mfcol4.1 TaxID=1761899 RepID=UPI000B83A4DA|nr:virulence factor TspB C-terminal domain-related protein [Ralstonia sp. 25mfcol4.1]